MGRCHQHLLQSSVPLILPINAPRQAWVIVSSLSPSIPPSLIPSPSLSITERGLLSVSMNIQSFLILAGPEVAAVLIHWWNESVLLVVPPPGCRRGVCLLWSSQRRTLWTRRNMDEHRETRRNMEEHGRTWKNMEEHGRTWRDMEEHRGT